jgi:hypothetical protein
MHLVDMSTLLILLSLGLGYHHTRGQDITIESRLEGGGVNRANLKFTNLITTTSRVSVRNKNESERGRKTNRERIKE